MTEADLNVDELEVLINLIKKDMDQNFGDLNYDYFGMNRILDKVQAEKCYLEEKIRNKNLFLVRKDGQYVCYEYFENEEMARKAFPGYEIIKM